MPTPYRGQRVPITVRLPVDEYREVCIRAKKRRWSLSDYIGYCVEREIIGRGQADTRTLPKGDEALFRQYEEEPDGERDDG